MSFSRELLLVVVSILLLSQLASLDHPFPRGWDVFYHMKVVELMSGDGLAPFDGQSAGGRVQSYPPGYHVLMLSTWQLTGVRLEMVGRLLSPILFCATLLALFELLGAGPAAVFGVLLFGTSPETFGAFSSAAMPQTLGLFAMIVALRHRRLALPMALLIGFSHWLSAGVLVVLLWLQELWPDVKSLLVWVAGALAAFTPFWPLAILSVWKLRRHRRELAVTMFLLLPIMTWKIATGAQYAAPSWGSAPDLFSYIYKTGAAMPVAFLFFLNTGPALLQTLTLLAMSQFFPFIPVRFILYLMLTTVMVIAAGVRKRRIPEKSVLAATALLSFALLSSQLDSGYWMSPDIQVQDVDALKWTDMNTASTLLAYKDSSAFWAYYYTDNPTILDGFSEGVPDVYERMKDEFEFYESENIRHDIIERWQIRYQFINLMEREMFSKIFDFSKFEAVPRVYANNQTEILHYP